MTRAIDRLIVSGAIDQDRKADASTPIGWVLERLDASELDEVGAEPGPVEIERGGARLLIRLDRHAARAALRGGAPDGGAARALRGGCERRRAGGGARARTAGRGACPAAPPGAPAVVQRALALRALLVSVLRRTRGRASSRRCVRLGSGADRPRRDRDRRCRARPARADRPPRSGRSGRSRRDRPRPLPGGNRRRARAHQRLRGVVLRVRAGRASRRARGSHARTTLRLRARRRPPPRPHRCAPSRRVERARPRLQDELARGGRARRDRRGRLPVAAARLRAGLLPGRCGAGRGRLPLPRAPGRGRLGEFRAFRCARARIRALGRDRSHSGGGVPADPRASSSARTARRSTSSAPGRACATAADGSQLRLARRGGASGRSAIGSSRSSSGCSTSIRTRRSRSGSAATSSCSSP